MVLDNDSIKKINEFVCPKPRTIQEIAQMLGKNWRTADNYVEKIKKESGKISTRTFRKGTRGALKIVYWNSLENIHSSQVQEKLFRKLESSRNKKDFSPFDIYQYIDKDKKDVFVEQKLEERKTNIREFVNLLEKSESQLLSFSGNLSYINLSFNGRKIKDILMELAKKKISIKILCRVDIPAIKNIEEVLAINEKLGRQAIEIRHFEHPLRALIIDTRIARLKEILDPDDYKRGELDKKTFIFYKIYDKEWIEWMQKVFWNLFRTAMPAEKRIEEIKKIVVLS